MKSFTDFTPLNHIPAAEVKLNVEKMESGDNIIFHTYIINPSDKVAFLVVLTLNDENGESIYPVFWDDNYISLLPGEKRDVSCSVSKNNLRRMKPKLILSGWNIKPHQIDIN